MVKKCGVWKGRREEVRAARKAGVWKRGRSGVVVVVVVVRGARSSDCHLLEEGCRRRSVACCQQGGMRNSGCGRGRYTPTLLQLRPEA